MPDQDVHTKLDRIESELAEIKQLLVPKPRKPSKPRVTRTVKYAKTLYTDKFQLIWEDYPDTTGASKKKAFAAYNKRLKETKLPLQEQVLIHVGVLKYAKYCKATGRWPKLPETFFGPHKHYENDWTLPKVKPAADPDKRTHPEVEVALKRFDPKAGPATVERDLT